MVLKMEVGKVYTDGKTKVRCVAVLDYEANKNWPYVCVTLEGTTYHYNNKLNHCMVSPFLIDINGDTSNGPLYGTPPANLGRLREYKEPVVYRRDIFFMWSGGKSTPVACISDVGVVYSWPNNYVELPGRTTVECVVPEE